MACALVLDHLAREARAAGTRDCPYLQKDRPETVRKHTAHRDQMEKDVLHDETKVNRAAT